MFKNICVFCGSNYGKSDIYKVAVKQFGELLGEKNINLVYGGGNVGLMGELSRSVLAGKGEVIGVIPKKLYDNVEHIQLTDLIVVDTMHERKAKMYDLADGFVALPGGIGTIEELTEALTWLQLGYHQKPIGILNINHFYDKLKLLLDHMVDEGFLKGDFLSNLIISDCPSELIQKMESLRLPNTK